MKQLLIFSNGDPEALGVKKLAEGKGYSVYTPADRQEAIELIRTQVIDVMFVHSDVKMTEQLEFAESLWKKNVSAPFVVFNLTVKEQIQGTRVKLYGAETAFGPDAYQKLGRVLTSVQTTVTGAPLPSKIIVVDDQSSSLDILCLFVEGLGDYEVIGKNSAIEAFSLIKEIPDQLYCVITDLQMPRMSGIDLILDIRKDKALCHLPVVVLTAYGTGDSLIDCLKAGASGFLVKPPRRGDLERELGRAGRMLSLGEPPCLAEGEEIELIQDVMIERRSL